MLKRIFKIILGKTNERRKNALNLNAKALEGREIREFQDETEYNTLRFEISQTINRGFSTINLAFTATVIILGFNLSLKPYPNLFIFFAPQIILSLAIIQIIQGHYGIIQNAVYIKTVIEKNKKRWENWMSHLRYESSSNSKLFNPLTINFITNFFTIQNHLLYCIVAGFLCCGLDFYYGVLREYWQCYSNFIHNFSSNNDQIYSANWDCIIFTFAFLCSIFGWTRFSKSMWRNLSEKEIKKYENDCTKNLLHFLSN